MTERVEFSPAVTLKRAVGLANLYGIIQKGGLEALLATPIPETIVLPLNGGSSGVDYTGEEFVVELSTRGTTPLAFFLHLIVESRYSGAAVISFSQNQIGSVGGGRIPRVNWSQNDWLRWCIWFSASGVSYRFANHAALVNPFGDNVYYGLDYRRVRALVLGTWDLESFSVADVRFWKGRCLPALEEQLEFLGGRRLDGRESQLMGYWKLAEGQGERLVDSSRLGNHGILYGGKWVEASQSDLRLECSFEVVRQRQEELRQQCERMSQLKGEVANLLQQTDQLTRFIQRLEEERKEIEQQKQKINEETELELQTLKTEFAAWKKAIDEGGKVGLDHYSESVAKAVQEASEELAAKKEKAKKYKLAQPYQLQSVGLDVKMLPVQNEGEADFRVIFPQPEDPTVQPGQLSTLALSFEPRLQEPEKKKEVVPDVRGYTEVLARRILSGKGFRVEMLDQAVDKEELIDRVIGQVPEPDPEKPFELNGTVTLLLGRASGGT